MTHHNSNRQRSTRNRAAILRSPRAEQAMEQLERRACPAVVAVSGPMEVDEAAGTAAIVITLSEPVSRPVRVSYSVRSNPATAAFGSDYRLQIGARQIAQNGVLSFLPGKTSKTITVRLVNDNVREGNESFTFLLQRARNVTLAPASASLALTIVDDDAYTAALVGPAIVSAGDSIDYRLELSSPATRRETFFISTRNGTAKVTDDYRPLSRVPVTIQPGQSSALVRFVTVADTNPDYEGTVFVDIEPMSPGFPQPAPFQITIAGSLGPLPPDIGVADIAVSEGADGTTTTATFNVTLSAPWTSEISVSYATENGSATASSGDYLATAGILVFAPGQTSQLVSVTINGDDLAEQDETFRLLLSNPVGGILMRDAAVATIANDDGTPPPAFQITVVFPDNSLTPAQQLVFEEAAARWSEIIVGDLPDITYQGRVIDDIEIIATAPFIDGPNGVLGQAGPTNLRPGSRIPFLGEMEFDSADIAAMVTDGSFAKVIKHEMGHVLGFGTLWQDLGLVNGIGTTNPIYVGTNAVREFQAISGSTAASIPVENTGGPGTAGGHWRESVFNNELMTGYLNPGVNPISRITVGSLEDMGYLVDYTAADAYIFDARRAAFRFNRTGLSQSLSARRFMLTAGTQVPVSLYAAAAFGTGSDTSWGSEADEPVTTRLFRAIGGQQS